MKNIFNSFKWNKLNKLNFNCTNNTENLLHFKFDKSFSSINLVTVNNIIDRSENLNFNKNINWELSKVWITPHSHSFLNSLEKNVDFINDENETCKIVTVGPMIQKLDFERFVRKMGLTLSREQSVYIQDGIYIGKKVRIVTSNSEDASNMSNIFEEKGDFVTADLHVLYLTSITDVGEKRFVFYDKQSKVIISNTKNLRNIEKAISDL